MTSAKGTFRTEVMNHADQEKFSKKLSQLVARDMDEFEESITLIQHAHGVCLFTDCDISLIELLMSDCSSATRLATSLMHVEPVTCLG